MQFYAMSVLSHLTHVNQSRDPSLEQRRAVRDLVDMVSHVSASGRTHGVRIINISPLGLMCRTDADLYVGERVKVWLPMMRDLPAEIRWMESGRVGMEFLGAIEPRRYARMLSLIPPRRAAW